LIHNTFQLTSPQGGAINGDVRMREGPPPRTAIVVVHGFKGFKDWGFFPHLCTRLAVDGHAVVSFNFSHNGIGPDPELFTDLEGFSRNTLTREVDELNHVLKSVVAGKLTSRPPRRIGMLGHSRGGAVAILAAGETPEVDVLTTWGAVDHLDRWTEATIKEWREKGVMYILNQRTGQHLPLSIDLLEDYEANRIRLDLGRIAPSLEVPWLIVHGKEDLTVSVQEGERLSKHSGTTRLHLIEGAGHTFEAVHPFAGSTPALEEALASSIRHFRNHLGEE
jgi:pimeloyl-ACP methyl ester carboxylesterase